MCIGGAAVFIVLMTMRKRRLQQQQRRPHGGGGGSRDFGYDGVRLHGETGAGAGAGGGKASGQGGLRWPRRRNGPGPPRGGKGAGPKQVAIELGRGGFDRDSDEELLAGLKLEQGGAAAGGRGGGGGRGGPPEAVVGVRVPQEGSVRNGSAQGLDGREGGRAGLLLGDGQGVRQGSEHEALLGGEPDGNFEGSR